MGRYFVYTLGVVVSYDCGVYGWEFYQFHPRVYPYSICRQTKLSRSWRWGLSSSMVIHDTTKEALKWLVSWGDNMHRWCIGSSNLWVVFFFFGGVIKMRSVTRTQKCEPVGFFFSLTTDINRVSPNLLVPATEQHKPGKYNDPGVRIHNFFASGCQSIPFRLQTMATLNEGDHWQMCEFIRV